MFQKKKFVQKIKIHILCSITRPRKKKCTVSETTAHAHCMLDNEGYQHTLRMCNTYCLATVTMVPRMRINATQYVHYLSLLCYNKMVHKVIRSFERFHCFI
jgi:hypothetical protein